MAEPDSDSSDQLLVAYQRMPLDPPIVVEVGVIINAIRTSLDMLAAALAQRHGIDPSPKTHFPIYRWRKDFLFATQRIKKEKWLSRTEIAAIKRLRPYKRGDKTLYPLHQLDILRKHERLIAARPITSEFRFYGARGGRMDWRRLKDKTVLMRFPNGTYLNPSKGNTNLLSEITFNEPPLGLLNEPAIPTLRRFSGRVAEIIKLFDVP